MIWGLKQHSLSLMLDFVLIPQPIYCRRVKQSNLNEKETKLLTNPQFYSAPKMRPFLA